MRCPWFRHCQSAIVGLLLVVLTALGVILWTTNQRGFDGEWGLRLQEQLAQQGLHAEFSSVRLSMSRGLVARDLVLYDTDDQSTVLASAELLELDIDRSRALRGHWEVRSIDFSNAFLRLPEVCAPHHLSQLSGTATLCRENCLSIRDTSGRLGELDIRLDAILNNFSLPDRAKPEEEEEDPLENFIIALQGEIARWSSSETLPPSLDLHLRGDLEQVGTLEGRFEFTAPRASRYSYAMTDLAVRGLIHRHGLLIEKAFFSDGSGPFSATGHYDFKSRVAEIEAESGAALDRLLRTGLHLDSLDKLTFTKPPQVAAKGRVYFHPDAKPDLEITGRLSVEEFRFLGSSWSSLHSDFSLQRGDLYLRDLALTHPDGELTGQLLFQDELVRYRAQSNLPAERYKPFLKKGGAIEAAIAKADFRENSEINLSLIGSIRPSQLTDWSASGSASVQNLRYGGTPVLFGQAKFNLTPLQAIYSEVEVDFDLTESRSFRSFGGPESAVVRADSIRFDRTEGLTTIDHLHGVCWPSTVLGLFLPKVSSYLERTYRASEPPAFSSSGQIDYRPDRLRTSFHTRIECPAPLYYRFLGQDVTLRHTSALIHSRPLQVDVKELSSYAFSGPLSGGLSVLLPKDKSQKPDFRGSVLWTRLRLSDIGDTYGFEKIEKGLVTGRLDFSGTAGRIETFNGTGNFGLEQGELFKAPVFGPLSPLIAGLQGHEKASHETARDASANFLIRDGILMTDDFITVTDSLTVHAEGSIDLGRKTLDMTARADTEGLLKLVTLPLNLTPLSGLFQFRGTGSVAEPKWENTPFTRRVREKKPPLFAPPPKARVVPE